MAKKMGLGRGLSAILPDVEEVVESVDQVSESAAPVPADAVAEIPVGDIDPNRNQPRKKFDDDALLRRWPESIRHNGVISPILVARDNGRYTIIAGERRWRAARLANLSTIPAIVREWDDIKRQEAALVENIQREDLNAIEEAQGISRLMNECALTQEAVAERLGRSRSAVANLLRLLNLPARIQAAVIDGALSAGPRARAGGHRGQRIAGRAVRQNHAVRLVCAPAGGRREKRPDEKKEKPQKLPLPVEYEELTERLRTATGLKVKLEGTPEKGKITLQYTSEEELQRLWEWMER